MATLPEIRDRIGDLFAVLGVTALTGEEERIGDGDLPAVEVFYGEVESVQQVTMGTTYSARRVFQCHLFVKRVAGAAKPGEDMAAIDACLPYLEGGAKDVTAHFLAHPGLKLNDAGIVMATGPARADGPFIGPYKGNNYGIVVFRLPVVIVG